MLLGSRTLRKYDDDNRVVAIPSQSHTQVATVEAQKPGISEEQFILQREEYSRFKRKKRKMSLCDSQEKETGRGGLTLSWFLGSLTALPVVAFCKCILILFFFFPLNNLFKNYSSVVFC